MLSLACRSALPCRCGAPVLCQVPPQREHGGVCHAADSTLPAISGVSAIRGVPFRFEPRVTSRFSHRRLHPVLGVHRPHLGVDYGAPTGTPVIAVATGTVVSASKSGGSGNMVRLRHTNGYETYYLHLSAFAKGVRPGARVVQGQVVGRVGSTGLATGPHLDYRMRKNGSFVNPLLEHRKLPPGDPVPEQHLAAFQVIRDHVRARMFSVTPAVDLPGVFAQ